MNNATLENEVQQWLQENWHADLAKALRAESYSWEASDILKQWLNKVVEARWAVPTWDQAVYGRGLDKKQAKIISREFAKAGAPGAGQDRLNLWANTLLATGSDALKAKLIGPILKAEVNMCLLYSEPNAGSDLAGIRTRADLKGDHYIANGQKVWTSGAKVADYGMLIARTDWDVPKHKGISFFFCPMKQEGIEVRPIRQITDESHFNEVFITDAKIPVQNRLGKPGDGWKVLNTALAYERSQMGEVARGGKSKADNKRKENPLVALARKNGRLDNPQLRQELAQTIAYRQLNNLNTARAKANLSQGSSASIMSLGKLAMSRILHEEARVQTKILDAQSLLCGDDYPEAEDANFLALNAYFTSIGGGTDQVQRNIIGERVLGLPKEPEVDKNIAFKEVRT